MDERLFHWAGKLLSQRSVLVMRVRRMIPCNDYISHNRL
jgi:hypothetical protein